MNYDEQIAKWAASKLDIPQDSITKVEFEMSEGRWWSDITYEEGYSRARVATEDGDHRIYLDYEDFGRLIREILDA